MKKQEVCMKIRWTVDCGTPGPWLHTEKEFIDYVKENCEVEDEELLKDLYKSIKRQEEIARESKEKEKKKTN